MKNNVDFIKEIDIIFYAKSTNYSRRKRVNQDRRTPSTGFPWIEVLLS